MRSVVRIRKSVYRIEMLQHWRRVGGYLWSTKNALFLPWCSSRLFDRVHDEQAKIFLIVTKRLQLI